MIKRTIALLLIASACYGVDVDLGSINDLTWTGSGTERYASFAAAPVAGTEFIITVKTDSIGTSADNQYTLPLREGQTYNFTASFDGVTTNHAAATDLTLTFPSGAGTYDVEITGTFAGMDNEFAPDLSKLIEVTQWGTDSVWGGSLASVFRGLTKLVGLNATDDMDTTGATSMDFMFHGCSIITNIYAQNWDTSEVTTMEQMLAFCWRLAVIDVSNWDVGKVETLANMFKACVNLEYFNADNWQPSNVTTFAYMFTICSSLTNVQISSWDTSSATAMNQMFDSCAVLKNFDAPSWDTADVTTMYRMFRLCDDITNFNIQAWDVSKVQNMDGMFNGNDALVTLDLSGWDTGACTDMTDMFNGDDMLTTVYATGWDTTNMVTMASMFVTCGSLTEIFGSDTWAVNSLGAGGMASFCPQSTLTTSNYSAMLVNFDSQAALAVDPNLNAGSSKFNVAGGTARSNLVNDGWTITDGGLE